MKVDVLNRFERCLGLRTIEICVSNHFLNVYIDFVSLQIHKELVQYRNIPCYDLTLQNV